MGLDVTPAIEIHNWPPNSWLSCPNEGGQAGVGKVYEVDKDDSRIGKIQHKSQIDENSELGKRSKTPVTEKFR